jgi:hypothetical protein
LWELNNGNGEKNSNLIRLTHLETTAFTSEWDARTNELLTVVMTENGPDLVRIKEQNLTKITGPLPKISPLFEKRYPAYTAQQREELYKQQVNTDITEYQPTHYLIPQYWFPNIYSTDNGLGFEAATGGFDHFCRH